MHITYTIKSINNDNFDHEIRNETMQYDPPALFLDKAEIVVTTTPNKFSVSINNVLVREQTAFTRSPLNVEENIRYAIDKYKTIQTDRIKARMSHLWSGTELLRSRLNNFDGYMPSAMKDRYIQGISGAIKELNSLELEMYLY